jgi:hypothetical protein
VAGSKNRFVVTAVWDDDPEVWVAESDEVPGLITEAESKTRLKEKLAALVPELLELNSYPFDPREPIEIAIKYNRAEDRREEHIRLPQVA